MNSTSGAVYLVLGTLLLILGLSLFGAGISEYLGSGSGFQGCTQGLAFCYPGDIQRPATPWGAILEIMAAAALFIALGSSMMFASRLQSKKPVSLT